MATNADTTGHALSIEQENAIDLLVTSASDQETATAVGVTRQTVCGWRNHHPGFIATLNSRRLEVWGASSDRLRSLLPKALDVLEGALTKDPDPRVAVKVVELAGLARQGREGADVRPPGIGPTDPEEVVRVEKRRAQDAWWSDVLGNLPEPPADRD